MSGVAFPAAASAVLLGQQCQLQCVGPQSPGLSVRTELGDSSNARTAMTAMHLQRQRSSSPIGGRCGTEQAWVAVAAPSPPMLAPIPVQCGVARQQSSSPATSSRGTQALPTVATVAPPMPVPIPAHPGVVRQRSSSPAASFRSIQGLCHGGASASTVGLSGSAIAAVQGGGRMAMPGLAQPSVLACGAPAPAPAQEIARLHSAVTQLASRLEASEARSQQCMQRQAQTPPTMATSPMGMEIAAMRAAIAGRDAQISELERELSLSRAAILERDARLGELMRELQKGLPQMDLSSVLLQPQALPQYGGTSDRVDERKPPMRQNARRDSGRGTTHIGEDDIDLVIQMYFEENPDFGIEFEKVRKGWYQFGTPINKRVFMKMTGKDRVIVRVGGGWKPLEKFFVESIAASRLQVTQESSRERRRGGDVGRSGRLALANAPGGMGRDGRDRDAQRRW